MKIYTTADGLPANSILCIAQDNQGDLWIGTRKGVSRFNGTSFINYNAESGFTNREVWAVLCDKKGAVWCTTEDGLYRLINNKWQRFTRTQTGLDTDWFSQGFLFEDQEGIIWGGAYRSRPFKFEQNRFTQLDIDRTQQIAQDESGNLFLLSWSSLYQIQDNKHDVRLLKNIYDAFGPVMTLSIDRNNTLWVTTDKSLIKISNDGQIFNKFDYLLSRTGEKVWHSVADSKNNIWLAHEKSISRFKGAQFHYFNEDNGLSEAPYYFILEDRQNQFWFGTENGLAKFDNIAPELIISTPIPEIIKSRQFAFQFKAEDGNLGSPPETMIYEYVFSHESEWHSVEKGLVSLNDLQDSTSYELQVRVTDEFKNSSQQTIHIKTLIDTSIPTVKIKNQADFVAPVDKIDILMEFSGEDDRTRPEDLLFSYKLEKDNKVVENWSPYNTFSRVTFHNLPSGSYTLFYRVKDEGGNESQINQMTFMVESSVDKPRIALKDFYYLYFEEKDSRPLLKSAPMKPQITSNWISFAIENIDDRPEKKDLVYSIRLTPKMSDWSLYRTENKYEFSDLMDAEYHLSVRARDKAGFVSRIIDSTFAIINSGQFPQTRLLPEGSLGKGKVVGKIVYVCTETVGENCLYSFRLDSSQWMPFQESNCVDFPDITIGKHTIYALTKNSFGIDPTPASYDFEYERIKDLPIIRFTHQIANLFEDSNTVSFTFQGEDDPDAGDKTPFDSLRYSYRMIPMQPFWSKPTSDTSAIFTNLKNSSYFFQVKAIDLNDNESVIPAEHFFTVNVIPFYRQTLFLIIVSSLFVASLSIFFTIRRTKGKIYEQRYNPYIVGEAVHDPEMFFGRAILMQDIFESLKNNSLCLTGERRIGKTTILEHIEKNARRPFFSFFCNLESVKADMFYSRMMQHLWNKIHTIWPQANLELVLFKKERNVYDDVDFEEDLEKILQFLREKYDPKASIIMCLDEIDSTQSFPPEIHQSLRNVFQTYQGMIRMVAAGVSIRRGDWSLPTSPWYNFFEFKKIKGLEQKYSALLITKPVKEFYDYEKQAINFIMEKTDGKPFYIQLICKNVINKILNEKRQKVKLEDVENIYDNLVRLELNREFEIFWEGLSKSTQNIMLESANGKEIVVLTEYKQEIENNDYNYGHRVITIDDRQLKFSTLFYDWLKINYL